MKKITLTVSFIALFFSASIAQNQKEYEYLVNLNEEVWIKRYDNLEEVESKELQLENGYRIYPGGLVIMPNGKKVKIKPGEMMDLKGGNAGQIKKANIDNVMADFHSQNFKSYKKLMKQDAKNQEKLSQIEAQEQHTADRLNLLEKKAALSEEKSKLLSQVVFTDSKLKKDEKKELKMKYVQLENQIQSINQKLNELKTEQASIKKGEE